MRGSDAASQFVSLTSRFAPGTFCGFVWGPADANGFPKGDPWPGGNIDPAGMQVGWGATLEEWHASVVREASDPIEGSSSWTQKPLKAAKGEKYILSARHNVLKFSAWPATLAQVTHLAYALAALIPSF